MFFYDKKEMASECKCHGMSESYTIIIVFYNVFFFQFVKKEMTRKSRYHAI